MNNDTPVRPFYFPYSELSCLPVVLLQCIHIINLVPSTARACRDRGKENDLDDVHLLAGEEMQWWIFLVVTSCTPPFNVRLSVAYT